MAKPLVDVYTPGASRKLGAAPLVDRPQPFDGICFLFVFSYPEYVFCLFFLIRLFGYFFSFDIPGWDIRACTRSDSGPLTESPGCKRASLRCKNALSGPLPGAGDILPAQVSLSLSYFGGCWRR